MVTGCVSDIDGCQRAGREVVNESTGFVYVRQAGSPPTHHHHWICPALSRYAVRYGISRLYTVPRKRNAAPSLIMFE